MKKVKIDEARSGMIPKQSDSGAGYSFTSKCFSSPCKEYASSWVRIEECKRQNTKQK